MSWIVVVDLNGDDIPLVRGWIGLLAHGEAAFGPSLLLDAEARPLGA
jgi:hypothetical protein